MRRSKGRRVETAVVATCAWRLLLEEVLAVDDVLDLLEARQCEVHQRFVTSAHPNGIFEDVDHGPDPNSPSAVFLKGFADLSQHGVEQACKSLVVHLADWLVHLLNAAITPADLPTRKAVVVGS